MSTRCSITIALIDRLQQITGKQPTQTKRTPEMDEFHQFSTPPALAFAAAWSANIVPGEPMLEPSAKVGGIAMYGEMAGGRVVGERAVLAPLRRAGRRAAGLAPVQGERRTAEQRASGRRETDRDRYDPSVFPLGRADAGAARHQHRRRPHR
jgi:hypothetical protein